MDTPLEYASFLIRLWREPSPEGKAGSCWRGEILFIQSGERRPLNELAELIAFMREGCADASVLSASSSG